MIVLLLEKRCLHWLRSNNTQLYNQLEDGWKGVSYPDIRQKPSLGIRKSEKNGQSQALRNAALSNVFCAYQWKMRVIYHKWDRWFEILDYPRFFSLRIYCYINMRTKQSYNIFTLPKTQKHYKNKNKNLWKRKCWHLYKLSVCIL